MYNILITGGAGFIGSNLCETLLEKGHNVTCLDNFTTGKIENIIGLIDRYPSQFNLIFGDIRNIDDCQKAIIGNDYVLHQAALGSVPRSINDPITSNNVNINGFLNMLVASRDANIKRFIYAASSSTYGDSETLPKIENIIGNPLSPYAITKYVNELYADVFSKTYNMECIGLRYFNVFGKRQNPNGAYAAVIPLWVKQLINHQRPIINGNGEYSRDFTYIENVIEANEKALSAPRESICNAKGYYNEVFNVAFGENTSLNELYNFLRAGLSKFDNTIAAIEPIYGEYRKGDIPHSLASIEKAKQILGYNPKYSAKDGFNLACEWYWHNIK